MSFSPALVTQIKRIHRNVASFSKHAGAITLRTYQEPIAKAIIESVEQNLGRTFVVMMSRQSGKNELQAQIETYLLSKYRLKDKSIVKASPTFKPQTQNAMQRLEDRLKTNLITKNSWKKRSGYQYLIGRTVIHFYSANKRASVVSATASLLLELDEAQDILPEKYDKDFAPMVASTNATRVFWGTAWTTSSLLARTIRECREAEKEDGEQRVFIYTADDVRKVLPEYGLFVDGEIKRLGRNHPFIKTQFFCQELNAEGKLFNAARMALINTREKAHEAPQDGSLYAFLIDVAGQDEAIMSDPTAEAINSARDSTTLSIVEIDLSTIETQAKPSYKIVHRVEWLGQNHLTIFGKLKRYADNWRPSKIVIDASGVGEGLWSLLNAKYGDDVLPVKFSSVVKSEIGWGFITAIESGRFSDATHDAGAHKQYIACESEIKPGPGKILKWSVPENARDESGLLIHDDKLLADSLVAILDKLEWTLGFKSTFVKTGFS